MTKGPILQEIWDNLSEERKQRIKKNAARKMEAYRNLQDVRNAVGLTQVDLTERLNKTQGGISRIEKTSDLLFSTLKEYIEAVGGKLDLTVTLPGKSPMPLTGLGDLIEHERRPE